MAHITKSNSLAVLAHEIDLAHADALQLARGAIDQAIKCGNLLLDAKKQVEHGEWLPWLGDNCTLSERSAQAYMMLAREYPKLEAEDAQRVADLSFRQALREVATASHTVAALEPEYKEKALTAAEESGGAMRGVFHAVKRNESRAAAVRVPDHPPLGELLNGRVVEVLVKEPDHAWCVAIHPNEAGLKLLNRYRLGQTRYARRRVRSGPATYFGSRAPPCPTMPSVA